MNELEVGTDLALNEGIMKTKIKALHKNIVHQTKSAKRWVDRSKHKITSSLPTLDELREEFMDWDTFKPFSLNDLDTTVSYS